MVGWKPGVAERRTGPCRGCVARLTGGRKTRCRVVRIIRPLVIRLMAAITGRRKTRIVVVHVAAGARHAGVRARERKGRVVVVEGALWPSHGVVADLAGRRKAELHVVHRRRGIVVVGLMAGHAGGAGQTVVVIHVA